MVVLVLPPCLLQCLLSFLLAVDDEHVDAEEHAAPANDGPDDNGDVHRAARVVTAISVAVAVAASRIRRPRGATARTAAALQDSPLSCEPVLPLQQLIITNLARLVVELFSVVQAIVLVFLFSRVPLGVQSNG